MSDVGKLADELEALAAEKAKMGGVPPNVFHHKRKLQIGEQLYRALPAIVAALRSADRVEALEADNARLEEINRRGVAHRFKALAANCELTDKLRDALKPFADYATIFEKRLAESFGLRAGDKQSIHGDRESGEITLGDLRKARAALTQEPRNG